MAAPIQASKKAVKAHPAGTTAGAGGLILGWLISSGHLTQDQAGTLTAAGGVIVAGISWAMAHGGIAGLWNSLFHGSAPAGA